MNNPLNLQREPELLPRDVLCTFPRVGTVLRVIIDGSNKNCQLGFLNTGHWAIFHEIVCEVHDGLWYGVLISTTKLRYIPQDHRNILCYQRLLLTRDSIYWHIHMIIFSVILHLGI